MAKFTLLLVDDEPAVIDMLEAILSEEGYVIHTAGSGEEALDSMRGRRIDAALLDMHLPGMNGLDLLKEVKKLYPPCPGDYPNGSRWCRGSCRGHEKRSR